MKMVLLFFAALLTICSADVTFRADVVVSGDTSVNGVVEQTMWYHYVTATPASSTIRIDTKNLVYNGVAFPFSTYYVYSKSVIYRFCSSCEAETHKQLPDRYERLSSDFATGNTWNGCSEVTRPTSAGGTLRKLWFDGNRICRAYSVPASGSAKYLTFTNLQTFSNPSSDWTQLMDYQTKESTCPKPVCNRVMDLVLILDESGSIWPASQWVYEIDFARNLIDSFTVSATAANIGVVFFDHGVRYISMLSNNAASVKNAISTANQLGGATCIGCGLQYGKNVLDQPLPGRVNPAKVAILLTDGQNNSPYDYYNHLRTHAAALKNSGATVFAIGVTSYVSMSELYTAATNLTGVQTVFTTPTFSSLSSIITNLVQETCLDINPTRCVSCHGVCTCGQICPCPTCQDLGRCYTHQCTTPSQGCITKAVNCNRGNRCESYSCNNQTGCVYTPVTCSDGKVCTVDQCEPSNGCNYPPVSCDDFNACTKDSCVEPSGCQHQYTCDDGKFCTDDFCNNKTGCYSTAHDCNDNNECTTDSCSETQGKCLNEQINCDDNDMCTIDSCDQRKGCLHIKIDCEDGDICTDNTCNKATGCTNTTISCDACKQWLESGNSCPLRACETGKCVQKGESDHECVYTPWIETNCSSGNKCILDFCDPITLVCSNATKECANKTCHTVSCDSATGECVYTPLDCDTGDLCFEGYCENHVCKKRSVCESRKCEVASCNAGTCTYEDLDCQTGSECIVGTCDQTTGDCTNVDLDCDDKEVCTIDSCDSMTGCHHVIDLCDDFNPCTNDLCINGTGCSHTEKCDDGKHCTVDHCNMANGDCLHTQTECNEIKFSENEEGCFVSDCSETPINGKYCYKKVSPSAFMDVCGGCIKTWGSNTTVWNTTDRTSCVGALTWPKFAAVLTAGAIAGIVIACIIGAVIIGVSGFFATKELIRRSRLAQNQGAHNNPIYKENERELQNPTFGGK